ncbi:hypothetical protein CMI37_14340 [Candidatus Pacearchaeota archaeon]|nr:hypothetical protein [Candidatus Pacearchaeota archaeon]
MSELDKTLELVYRRTGLWVPKPLRFAGYPCPPCCTEPCPHCDTGTTPSAVQVVISGTTDKGCGGTTCVDDFNGTFVLDQVAGCDYSYDLGTITCRVRYLQVRIDAGLVGARCIWSPTGPEWGSAEVLWVGVFTVGDCTTINENLAFDNQYWGRTCEFSGADPIVLSAL